MKLSYVRFRQCIQGLELSGGMQSRMEFPKCILKSQLMWVLQCSMKGKV